MSERITRADLDRIVATIGEKLGKTLSLNAWTPGDRYGTRYRIVEKDDTGEADVFGGVSDCGLSAAYRFAQGVLQGIYAANACPRQSPFAGV